MRRHDCDEKPERVSRHFNLCLGFGLLPSGHADSNTKNPCGLPRMESRLGYCLSALCNCLARSKGTLREACDTLDDSVRNAKKLVPVSILDQDKPAEAGIEMPGIYRTAGLIVCTTEFVPFGLDAFDGGKNRMNFILRRR